MTSRPASLMSHSMAFQENIVLPGDTNAHDTMFGGLLMKRIDEAAAISARRHCRSAVVTASNDGVHFHRPIRRDDIVSMESFVCSVGKTSMEVFVKIMTEASDSGYREIAAVSFLTFVALDRHGNPKQVPEVVPKTDEEKLVFDERQVRKESRLKKRQETIDLIQRLAPRSWVSAAHRGSGERGETDRLGGSEDGT